MSASEGDVLAFEALLAETTDNQLGAPDNVEPGIEDARTHLQRLFTVDQGPFVGGHALLHIDALLSRCVSPLDDIPALKILLDGVIQNILSAGAFWETFSVENVGKAMNLMQAASLALFLALQNADISGP
jgi:hypothetical protein